MGFAFKSAGYTPSFATSIGDVRAMINARVLLGKTTIEELQLVVIGPKAIGTQNDLVAMYFGLSGQKQVVAISVGSNHPKLVQESVQAQVLSTKDETVKIQFHPAESKDLLIALERPGQVEAYQVRVVLGFWLWRRKIYKSDLPAGVSSFTLPDIWGKRIWPAWVVVKVDQKTRFVY